MSASRRVALGLGANLGDRLGALQQAVDGLAATDGLAVVAVSPVYETTPVGGPVGQPPYLNVVVVADSALSAAALLDRSHALEAAAGRERLEHWGPRTLDVDVLAVGGETSDDARLTLPHPRAAERAFVLVPWSDVDPTFVVPGVGAVGDLARSLRPAALAGVRRRDDLVIALVARRPGGTR